jgi:hypothetical protein
MIIVAEQRFTLFLWVITVYQGSGLVDYKSVALPAEL